MENRVTELANLLNGVADATNELITNDDYIAAINNALGILGKAINSDVVFLFENHQPPSKDNAAWPTCSLRFYWRANKEDQFANVENLQYQSYDPDWYYHLAGGKSMDIYISQTSEEIKDTLDFYGLKSAFLIPVLSYGKFWGFLGIGTDQLEREFSQTEGNALKTLAGTLVSFLEGKRNEKAYQESERRFRQVFQNNPAVKLVIDPFDGKIIDAGQSTCAFYGYEYEDLTSLTLYDMVEDNPTEVERFLTEAVRHQRSQFKFKQKKANGSTTQVELLTSPVFLNGTTFIFAIVNELGTRDNFDKATLSVDALLQRFIRYTHAAAVVIDQNRRILHASTRWISYFDYESTNWRYELLNNTIAHIPDSWRQAINSTLEGNVQNNIVGNPSVDEQYQKRMRLDSYPWYDSNGNVNGAILFVDYVSDTDFYINRPLESSRSHIPVNSSIEKERRLIARELHDSVGQMLSATHFNIEMLEHIDPDDHTKWEEQIHHIKKLLDTSIQEIRNISQNLRPGGLDDFGLIPAINNLVKSYQNSTQINLSFNSYDFKSRISDELGITIYRICQEALNNISRHSKANNASIELFERDKTVLLLIKDNGKGLPENLLNADELIIDSNCQGLQNIKERVERLDGNLSVDSQPSHGTELIIELPLVRNESFIQANT